MQMTELTNLMRSALPPEGESGKWRVEHRQFTEGPVDRLRAIFNGHGRYTPTGNYVGLLHGGGVIMSDTPDEIRDHWQPVAEAEKFGGRILVNGLGLGCITAAFLSLPNVEHVTVVEWEPDVIKLVEPTLRKRFGTDRLAIVHADALYWRPEKGTHYSIAWHDIWPSICEDNLPEMAKLNRSYGQRADWQGCWAQGLCRQQRERFF